VTAAAPNHPMTDTGKFRERQGMRGPHVGQFRITSCSAKSRQARRQSRPLNIPMTIRGETLYALAVSGLGRVSTASTPKSETPELGISATCREIRTVGGSMGEMIGREFRSYNDVYVYFLRVLSAVFSETDVGEDAGISTSGRPHATRSTE